MKINKKLITWSFIWMVSRPISLTNKYPVVNPKTESVWETQLLQLRSTISNPFSAFNNCEYASRNGFDRFGKSGLIRCHTM